MGILRALEYWAENKTAKNNDTSLLGVSWDNSWEALEANEGRA